MIRTIYRKFINISLIIELFQSKIGPEITNISSKFENEHTRKLQGLRIKDELKMNNSSKFALQTKFKKNFKNDSFEQQQKK